MAAPCSRGNFSSPPLTFARCSALTVILPLWTPITVNVTPAMALGVADHIWTIGELIEAALGDEGPKPEGRRVVLFRVIEGGK